MTSIKFGNADRKLVIAELEKIYNTKLKPIQILNSQKYLRADDGRRYCIVGGIGDWHGIHEAIFQIESFEPSKSALVIASKLKSKIDIYLGPLDVLVLHSDQLTHTKASLFEFNLSRRDNKMVIREVPNLILEKIGEIKLKSQK